MRERDDSVPEGLGAICPWVVGHVETAAGRVVRVATRWTWRDRLDALAVRWNIGRMRRRVEPRLYAVGSPGAESPLMVTANYKLSFDILRKSLEGVDAWVLVLDTLGINVWCAAGKGTFGTEELVRRLEVTGAARVVAHRVLILPQLGAPGVAAHEVRRQSGFKVVYGPVRAGDLPAFLRDGMRVSEGMRDVTFTMRERLAVVPVELVQRLVPALLVMAAFCLAAGIGPDGYRFDVARWPWIAVAVWGNFLAGVVLVPALLPWLPGRSFLGLMFTGSTPYTSASGVRREIRWAIPFQIVAAVAGLILWLVARWR